MATNKKAVKTAPRGAIEKKGGAGVGLGVAAVAAAMATAAGAYWLYGSKDAAKNRKSAKSFMLKARADVLEAVEKVSDINKQTYLNIVDGVVQRYSKVAGITSDEVSQMTKDLTVAWTHMQQVAAKAKKSSMANAKKTSKTVVKSVTTKAAKKLQ